MPSIRSAVTVMHEMAVFFYDSNSVVGEAVFTIPRPRQNCRGKARQLTIRSRRGKAEAETGCSRPRRGRMFEAEARQSEKYLTKKENR